MTKRRFSNRQSAIGNRKSDRRYVILHHTGVAEPHFDLMFEIEAGGALKTYRSMVWPIIEPTPVFSLPDHRREYLDYEGPVSNNRGRVARVESGTYAISGDWQSIPLQITLNPQGITLILDSPATRDCVNESLGCNFCLKRIV